MTALSAVASTVIEFHTGASPWIALGSAVASLIGTGVALYLGLSARRDQQTQQQLALRRESLDPVIDWLADADVALIRLNYERLMVGPGPVVEEAAAAARAHSLGFRRLLWRVMFVLGDEHPLVKHLERAQRAYGDMVRFMSANQERRALGDEHNDVVAWGLAIQGAGEQIALECGYPPPIVDEASVWRVLADEARDNAEEG